ncbi:MAG TPA: SIR2 family protein, partial [Kofleriaceae bacterium]|nr:SIR2 family protein [Kofleriaceae bacterium]
MPEHTIPPTLVDHIRAGRATLVIGVGIGGIPSWKQILERMNDALRERGRPGDDAASRDVDKLLHKASLVRAAGFLGRTLGEEACDAIVKQAWGNIRELPPIALALARLPFKQVWTTFPGDVFERAMNAELPEEWPAPRVVTWERAGDIDRRRRALLKILGDFDSYVVTPRSTRAMLSKADALREHVRGQYAKGSLIFVGFRFGDPDLAALLDRVFGMFEPPETDHYLVASGVGPVTLDELQSEHDMKVINLPGKGTDDRATEALLEWMGELERVCADAGVHLRQTRPDDDDLEGWIAVIEEDAHDLEAAEKLA